MLVSFERSPHSHSLETHPVALHMSKAVLLSAGLSDWWCRLAVLQGFIVVVLQLNWLNSYYEMIRRLVGPELKKQDLKEEYDWMMKHTAPFLIAGASAVVSSITLFCTVLPSVLLYNLL